MIALNDIVIDEVLQRTSSLFPVSDFIEEQNWGTSNVVVVYHYPAPLSFYALRHAAKLFLFSELKKNWDSYGADPVSRNAIAEAFRFIRYADNHGWQIYFVAPGKNGDVMVELKGKNKIAAEIYFDPDSTAELVIFGGDDCLYEGELDIPVLRKYFSQV